MPYKVNQERRHKIPKARYRVQNWRDYDAALRRCRFAPKGEMRNSTKSMVVLCR